MAQVGYLPSHLIEERLFRVAVIDAATGEVTKAAELPAYLKAVILSQPLHLGAAGIIGMRAAPR